MREARRRRIDPDALADEVLRTHPDDKPADLESALTELAAWRATLPELDGAVVAREARDELERR